MDVGHNVILHVVGQILHSRPTALISFPSLLRIRARSITIICEWLRQDVSIMKLFFIQNKAFNVNPSALREILNPYNNIDKTYLHSYDTQMTSA